MIKYIISATLIISLGAFVYFRYKVPFPEETIIDIFGQNFKKISVKKYDLGGYDLHGTVFFLYSISFEKGTLDSVTRKKDLSKYPTFQKGLFEKLTVTDDKAIIKWNVPL